MEHALYKKMCTVQTILFLVHSVIWHLTWGYNIGTDVSLVFHHEVTRENATYIFNAFLIGSNQPFYFNEHLDPRGLRPGQEGRVSVELQQEERKLTIIIKILSLDKVDEGTYVVTIIETSDEEQFTHKNYEKFVDVTYPPGKAHCWIEDVHFQESEWMTVSCNATVGSDDSGHLFCHQNSKLMPFLEPVRHHGGIITAVFWIDSSTEVRCCSVNSSFTDPASCNDFVSKVIEGDTSSTHPPVTADTMSTSDLTCTVIPTLTPMMQGQSFIIHLMITIGFGILFVISVVYIINQLSVGRKNQQMNSPQRVPEPSSEPIATNIPEGSHLAMV